MRSRGTKDYVRLKTIHNEAFNHLRHWATTQLWHSVCCDGLGCDGLKLKLHVMLQGKMEKLFDSTIKYDTTQWIVISQYITNEGEWNNSQREYMILACFLEGGCQNCGPYCFVTNFYPQSGEFFLLKLLKFVENRCFGGQKPHFYGTLLTNQIRHAVFYCLLISPFPKPPQMIPSCTQSTKLCFFYLWNVALLILWLPFLNVLFLYVPFLIMWLRFPYVPFLMLW